MAAKHLCEKLRRTWWMLHGARGGNVTLTFALALVPIVGLVGAAVDYSRANSIKAAMQAALDSTALAMSKTAGSLNSTDLQTNATDYFKAVFTRPDAQNVQITTSYSAQGSSLTVNGTTQMNTDFLGITGFKQLTITGTSTASWGTTKLQVALVLDNTGSMNSAGKIGALKTASHQLLTQLQNAAQNPGDVQVAIIPFTTDVNVGTNNLNATWLKWSYSMTATNTSCIGGLCMNGSTWQYVGSGGGTLTESKTGWTGCVSDRDQNYDAQITTPDPLTVATLFPANTPLFGCPAQMMPLGYNWAAMNTLIDSMVADGETNLTMGLVWGWQALTAGAPLNPPAPAPGTQKIMIFLTDGLNTANRWNNVLLGSGTAANIDARTQLVCNNIKGSGITVYTIQVDTGGDSPPSPLLQNCASDIGKWFHLTTAGEMVTTFTTIGTNLAKLHIAK